MKKDPFEEAYKTLENFTFSAEDLERTEAEVNEKPEIKALHAEIERLKFINDVFDGKYTITEKDGKRIATRKPEAI